MLGVHDARVGGVVNSRVTARQVDDPRCHQDDCGKLLSNHDENFRCDNGRAFKRHVPQRHRGSQSFSYDEVRVMQIMAECSRTGRVARFDTKRTYEAFVGVEAKVTRMLGRIRAGMDRGPKKP